MTYRSGRYADKTGGKGIRGIIKSPKSILKGVQKELGGFKEPETPGTYEEDSRKDIDRKIEMLDEEIRALPQRYIEEGQALAEAADRMREVYNEYLKLGPGYNEAFCHEFYREGGIVDCSVHYQKAVKNNLDAMERTEEMRAFLCHNYLNTLLSAMERIKKLQASEHMKQKETDMAGFQETMRDMGIDIPKQVGKLNLINDWERFRRKYDAGRRWNSRWAEEYGRLEKKLKRLNEDLETRTRKRHNLEAAACDYEEKLRIEAGRKRDRENCERLFQYFAGPQAAELISYLEEPGICTAEEYREHAKKLAAILEGAKDEDS